MVSENEDLHVSAERLLMRALGGSGLLATRLFKHRLITTSLIAKTLLVLGVISNRSSLGSPIVALLLR